MAADLSVNIRPMKTWKQTLLYTVIPVICLITLIYTSPLERLVITRTFWSILGGYVFGGLFLLFTKYQQTGKALLLSAGVIICLGIVALIFIVIAMAGIC